MLERNVEKKDRTTTEQLKDVQATKKVSLKSASKVGDAYNAKSYRLKKKLRK